MHSSASKPRKRFVGSTTVKSGSLSTFSNQIPTEILHDEHLNSAIKQLPSNYFFEIHKTVHHVRKNDATVVGLQMPEGLQMFACTISDIIERFTRATTIILGDVTYGACCVDDYTAIALGCDMLVHYGHSCLVPIDQTRIKTLYVFVEISIDSEHLERTIRFNFPSDRQRFHELISRSDEAEDRLTLERQFDYLGIEADSPSEQIAIATEPTKLALVSTIQFVASLQRLKDNLMTNCGVHKDTMNGLLIDKATTTSSREEQSPQQRKYWTGKYDVTIPRSKPLSPGEILGCTAPRLKDVDALLYLGDGRFHLEAIMIANPSIPAFRYDPYAKKLTRERYDYSEMQNMRNEAVESARDDMSRRSDSSEKPAWGVILGTLGRQGNRNQLQAITKPLKSARSAIPWIQILMSEISPAKLSLFHPHVSVFVQTSCPRLSIDWGYAFDQPLLSPYETAVAFGAMKGWTKEDDKNESYHMDFYEGGSPWATARVTVMVLNHAIAVLHDESMSSDASSQTIRLDIPPRFYLVPGTAFIVGSAIGLVRGGRNSSLQFLAENVHRPPRTVQGWYFYNKTKNYKVMLGGLKGGGVEGSKLGIIGLGWMAMEEGMSLAGWSEAKEMGAAIGTACMFSGLYQLGWKGTRQMLILGVMVGGVMKGLGMAKGRLSEWRTCAPME